MQQLVNFCPAMDYDNQAQAWPGGLQAFCRQNGLDGIELYLYNDEGCREEYAQLSVGMHLRFWPMWLEFWRGDTAGLLQSFAGMEQVQDYFNGAAGPEQWLQFIKQNMQQAAAIQPRYCVWHVSHCTLPEAGSLRYSHSDKEVLEATAEVINQVSASLPEHITLLFENLWWPGLTLRSPAMVDYFFSLIKRQNVGIMLDTGHLMNTQTTLGSQQEGVEFLCSTVAQLGSNASLIQGLHLSCSLSGAYQEQCRLQPPKLGDGASIMQHISSIDQHRSFTAASLAPFLDQVQPKYLVHELYYDNLQQLAGYVAQQQTLF